MEYQHIIDLQHTNIAHKSSVVLTDVNITVDKGEFVYLIGKTGSGKSSLLKTLYGELPAQGGTATMVGFDLTDLSRSDIPMLRRKIGIVFQDFQLLYDRSVEDNLKFVLRATGWDDKQEIDKRIDETLEKVGLSTTLRKSMPHQLSGGEQQSVAIARALLNNPAIILADEPTGNLDPDTTIDIVRLLRKISDNGQSVVMATHNYTLMQKYPSRVIRCENGKVICSVMQ